MHESEAVRILSLDKPTCLQALYVVGNRIPIHHQGSSYMCDVSAWVSEQIFQNLRCVAVLDEGCRSTAVIADVISVVRMVG